MSTRPALAPNTAAVVLVVLVLVTLTWVFSAIPSDHPRPRGLGVSLAPVVVLAALLAAWGHGRARASGDGLGRAVSLAVVGVCGAILLFLYVLPSGNSHRLGRNEGHALADIRTVMRAQVHYQSANAGHYDARLGCLAEPTACLPDYPAGAPRFLDADIASLEDRSGYRRSFHPGPAPDEIPPQASPTCATSWAFVAVPVEVGYTGARGFCGDSRGVICYTRDGTAPPVSPDGFCDIGQCEEQE